MLSIYKNDYLKIIISFLLIFLILINFGTNIYIKKVHADIVLTGVATKLFISILGALGVLSVVNASPGGVNVFFTEYQNYMTNIKGISNTIGVMGKLALTGFFNNVKTDISTLKDSIIEFYNLKKADFVLKDTSIPQVTHRVKSDNFFGTGSDWIATFENKQDPHIFKLDDTYTLELTSYAYNSYRTNLSIRTTATITYLNSNNVVKVLDSQDIIHRIGYTGDLSTYSLSAEYSSINNAFGYVAYNSISNEKIFSDSYPLKPLVSYVPDVPIDFAPDISSSSISNNIPFNPAYDGSITWYPEMTKTDLIDAINSSDISSYLEEILEMGKTGVISQDIPKIITDGEKVISVDFPDSVSGDIGDIGQGVGEQTGILTGILTGITGIFDWLKELFVIDTNYIMTKIETLQALINDKVGLPSMSPLTGLFGSIKGLPIPSNKYVNTDFINSLASTIRDWQRFFWYVVLMLFGANKVYKLVRKDDLIKFRNAD